MTGILGGLNWDDGASFLNIIGSDGEEIALASEQGRVLTTARTDGPQLSCWRDQAVSVAVYADEAGKDHDNFAKQVIEQYLESPENLNQYYRSAYSLVLMDHASRKVFLSVDLFARFPLYVYRDAQGVHFSTSSIALTESTGTGNARISPQSIFHYLYFHMVPTPNSIYQEIGAVESSHFVEISEKQYRSQLIPGSADMKPVRATATDSQRLRDALAGSVDQKAAECKATFLSGGLDSSTITGLLAKSRDGDVDAYSVGFDAEGYDEMPYARLAAKEFGVRHHEIYLTPADVVKLLPKIAARYEEPFGNSSALPTLFCATAAAADGHKSMLAGDGGDELFAGNERYAKQKLFEFYFKLPAAARKLTEVSVLNAPLLDKIPPFAKLQSYIQQARIPLPDRLETYNFFSRNQPADVIHPELVKQLDLEGPLKLLRATYQQPAEADSLHRMLWLDWKQTLADNDLRKVTTMCDLAGVDVHYPMLAPEMVELGRTLPSSLLLPGQKLRHFYKQSFAGFLPEEIINKPKQGFGLPFGVWMRDYAPLKEMAYDALSDLRKRNYLNDDYLDQLVKLHQHDHAAYYGEFIWVFMMLELWLQAHDF
ncbi:MAG: asparagine synthase C-terminal domain-containing protein [Pseudomonadales bacterium]|nr:asparagine synthase C-terminal domain-containing protein [Pseudomonadales bacterium]